MPLMVLICKCMQILAINISTKICNFICFVIAFFAYLNCYCLLYVLLGCVSLYPCCMKRVGTFGFEGKIEMLP